MFTETNDSNLLIDTDPERPLVTNVADFVLPRVGARFPNILLSFRYRLVRKTGLFYYQKESDIECFLEPDGWASTGSFSSPEYRQEKNMQKGNRELEFSTAVFIKLHDAKIHFDSSRVHFDSLSYHLGARRGHFGSWRFGLDAKRPGSDPWRGETGPFWVAAGPLASPSGAWGAGRCRRQGSVGPGRRRRLGRRAACFWPET